MKSSHWRPGQSGNPAGKPKGAKDHYPRSAKKLLEQLLEKYATEKLELIENALDQGLKAPAPASSAYLKIAIEHIKGAPDIVLNLKEKIVLAPRD
jgi:hypothetical protein